MDEFEKRLKQDARDIEARVSPELRARIDASLQGARPVPRTVPQRSTHGRLWWFSTLTGLAATAAVIVLLNWQRPEEPTPAPTTESVAVTVPDDPQTQIPTAILDIRNADFTSPLEKELINLQSDLEKARDTVRKDLDFTF